MIEGVLSTRPDQRHCPIHLAVSSGPALHSPLPQGRPLLKETQFSAITSAIARHSLSMFAEVIPATLMRPESTM